MNDFMQKSISESIDNVMGQIAGVDENLAGLFKILGDIIPEKERILGDRFPEEERISGDIFPDKERRRKKSDGKRRNKDTAERIIGKIIRTRGAINTIPFGEPGGCLEECVAIAFGKLKSEYGFNKIAQKVIDYWLNCGEENCRTVIVTNTWDITDFDRKFRVRFDSYTSSKNKDNRKHTVVIISYGDYGFSLQYLR